MTKLLGVDISEHNGNVDFARMKADGVKFAMLRTSWGHFAKDNMIDANVAKCKAAGLPYGFYHYSYASTDAEATQEAKSFLALCKQLGGYTYPLNLDMEDADSWKARNGVGDDQNLRTIKIFKEILEGDGQYMTLYMSKSWFDRLRAKNKALIDSIDPWLAHWGITEPSMDCGMWQYSSDGVVNGSSVRTDVNWCYKDYPSILANMGVKVSPAPTPAPKPTPNPVKKEKYSEGIKVCTNTLATSSDGSGKVYKGNWQGTITKVVPGAKYPYLLDNGNVGWTNDTGIDTDPHTPGASSTQSKPNTSKKEKYGEGIKVCTNTLATSSDGSGKVYKGDWTGWIGRVIPGARYPYRVDDSKGNAIGWTDTKGIDTDPHIR